MRWCRVFVLLTTRSIPHLRAQRVKGVSAFFKIAVRNFKENRKATHLKGFVCYLVFMDRTGCCEAFWRTGDPAVDGINFPIYLATG